ncbi:MAG: GxxExxY protein [Planctomycetaceae bacterium]|nr:GxxExxY protein [Planctomycetales bacterium]MCB9926883.1 GxxExxY protein [Planctomycetaceae bacterium]
MPIEVASEIRILSEDQFHSVAHNVMGVFFAVHNAFGRLMEEELYKRVSCLRCEAVGFAPALREVRIIVSCQDFVKAYLMDLLVCSGLMVEVKAVEQLTAAHRTQALNYLLLTGMQHGLLVNLRSNKVTKEFVSTTLDGSERRRLVVDDSNWRDVNAESERVKCHLLELLADWGGFLQLSLYREAIVHAFGGASTVLKRVPIYGDTAAVSTQEVCCLCTDTALALTAIKDNQASMRRHLQQFLDHTRLAHLQWINLHHHDITFRTLKRNSV